MRPVPRLDQLDYLIGEPKETVTLSGTYADGDAGAALLREASQGEPGILWVSVPRSWRERLFSWPWRPWIGYHAKPAPYRVTPCEPYGPDSSVSLEYRDGTIASYRFEQVTPPGA
jgi:hypothetical protein